jgi:NAD(P)H-dependent FMN reductase
VIKAFIAGTLKERRRCREFVAWLSEVFQLDLRSPFVTMDFNAKMV